MKKILPIFLVILFAVVAIAYPVSGFAQAPTAAQGFTTPAPGQITAPGGGAVAPVATVPPEIGVSPTSTTGTWVVDPEVTFTGKNAARSGLLLDWALRNYNWVCVRSINPGISQNGQCDDSNNPIRQYWSLIVVYIVVPMLFLVILVTALVIIISRGRSVTIMRFLPRFVAVILLIVFSYAIVQFLAQFIDVIQGFFLRSHNSPCPPDCISQKDLLYVGWKYETFIGLRLLGDFNAESSFISILLTKLTALTYFVMVILLIVRKIILWFFVIVSPIFPILLLYYPTRNTGKIWIGEFFRWLLYAPLFALFLKGLVFMWRNQIPLVFNNPSIGKADQIIFPTAINILLGGPKQYVTPTNSVNLTETFALYVVALIMLWTVIILPWILLQIFLEYASNFTPGDSGLMKAFMNNVAPKKPIMPGGGPATGPQAGGAVLSLPFAKKFSIPTSIKNDIHPAGAAKTIPTGTTTSEQTSRPSFLTSTTAVTQANKVEAMNLANIQVPSMRDIAKYETSLLSKDKSKQQSVTQTTKILERISNPTKASTPVEQSQFNNLKQKLLQQSQQGNLMATTILKAANSVSQQKTQMSTSQMRNTLKQMAHPETAPVAAREKMKNLNSILTKESKENNSKLASSILAVNDKTTDQEIQQIHSQLQTTKRDKSASSVNSVLFQQSNVNMKMKNALVQVGNPTSVPTANRESVVKLNQTLQKASREGNSLAASILSISDKTPIIEIENLQSKIMEAQEKGEPIAAEIASLAQKTEVSSLPAVNRVQAVNQQDYQAVKDMWKENYQNLDVPEGLSGRTDWIKDDISGIDEIVGLLSSTDNEKVKEGMDKVSSILPFLLVGGFSQTEIVGYLRAKQEAAKEVTEILSKEEDTKISVSTKKGHAEQVMHASMGDESSSSSSAQSSGVAASASASASEDEGESPLSNLSTADSAGQQPATVVTPVGLAGSVAAVGLKEIAKYETSKLTGSKEGVSDVEKALLGKLINPALVAEKERARFMKMHESLVQQGEAGNLLASEILSTKETASSEEIEKLNDKLKEEGKKKDSLVISGMAGAVLSPDADQGRDVTDEEYDEVEKLWEVNYRILPVPQEFGSDRVAWIKSDENDANETISSLSSSDPEKKKEGLQKATGVMPYLILGGFSTKEIITYLGKKVEAAGKVISQLQQEEDGKVLVDAAHGEEEKHQEAAQTDEKE